MAKNSKKPTKLQVHLNADNYIKTGKARNLPIVKCFINADWEDAGIASIIVARQHSNQNFTLGLYMADIFCVGVKDTHFYFNIPEWEFLGLTNVMSDNYELAECDYNLAHNIIFGSVAFAEEFNIPPHKDFSLTKMILEEDDDDIPLIDVEFGRDGMPFLIENSDNPKSKFYHSQLVKYAGEGNFHFLTETDQEDFEDEDDPEIWEEEDWDYFFDELNDCGTEEDFMAVMIDFFDAVRYIFEKTMTAPALETKKLAVQNVKFSEMELVYEPMSILDYEESAEETNEVEECHKKLKNFQNSKSRSKTAADKLIKMLQKAIAKWTKNPVFLNYLFSAYQLTNNLSAATEIAKLTIKLFPSYLFGKIAYARILIDKKQLDKVPELFNGEYNLKSVYPERNTFHVQEFLAFNNLWCHYFLEKNDLYMANLHYSMNTEIDVPEESMLDIELMLMLNIKICIYVKDLICNDDPKFKREELIKILVN